MDDSVFLFNQVSFREIIVVDDFSTFSQKLLYGKKPKNANEVLIYDYMAYNMIHYNIFEGSVSDIVGKQLVDENTNLSMKISGIISSNYDEYSYIVNDITKSSDFIESYLTSLQSIFCYPDFLNNATIIENNYSSVMNSSFINDDQIDESLNVNVKVKKIKEMSTNNLNFLAAIDNVSDMSGIVMTIEDVAYVLDINVNDVTQQIASDFLTNFHYEGITGYYDYSIERTYYYRFSEQIIGVVDNVEYEPEVIHYIYRRNEINDLSNYNFRQIYMSLGTNWEKNREIINLFKLQKHDAIFYEENPLYYYEGFTDYTPYGILISQSNSYLQNVKDLAIDIMYVLIIVSVIVLFYYTASTIRKYSYKIGVLKALGTSNGDITLMFLSEIVFLSITSVFISVLFSYILMSRINNIFVAQINESLVFFSVRISSVLYMSLVYVVMSIFTAIVPLLRIYMTSPMKIIRKYRKM